jgi:tRNA U34 5-methylaminomethyl-2-thiouridine-forming methyltransferase MnmC
MKKVNPEIIPTEDGSHTLYVRDLDEHYHSRFGALSESRHVYIEAGLNAARGNYLEILEMGFGTGLNAILTLGETVGTGRTVGYTGVELYPLDNEIINKLNYTSILSSDLMESFVRMHQAPWNIPTEITEGFNLLKIREDILELKLTRQFDLVYYDAFGPDKQPELWTGEIFVKIFRSMNPGAVLVTYSSKGLVRRNLAEAGFTVEKLPGPPGKRDMTRAWKE